MVSDKTKIVITSGEPAGIGPDICLDLLNAKTQTFDNTEIYIIADPELLSERAKLLGKEVQLQIHNHLDDLSDFYQADKLNIIPLSLSEPAQAGKLNAKNSAYVLSMLDLAHDMCLKKQVDAMVTGPIQKSIINKAGHAFTGHTEYLADKTASVPVMMLATSKMRVALATTHLPLKDVSQAITRESLTETLNILNLFLKQRAGIDKPRILVCGLNPHAGEDGNLGDEEINTITPVIRQLQQQSMDIIGPLPADTLFTPKYLSHADAVL
ncbi:MAG: 4-hydroxythreonine-4-phosphate dehydrogenase PdxA, partial [Gammaproteobacteria bacterium]|nr:4-hydroxythreonine-4-phosphate dehydrogenase PdxA [Gammaproteobacteria bacterium]